MLIKTIVIHESLIEEFRKKALKESPYEHIAAILGCQKADTLYVHAFDELEIIQVTNTRKYRMIQYDRPEEELEAATKLKYFGTIHSHPKALPDASTEDRTEFLSHSTVDLEDYNGFQTESLLEAVMGIMSVHRRKRIIESGIVFYNTDMEKINVIISYPCGRRKKT